MTKPTEHFESDHHALATGILLGVLMRGTGDRLGMPDPRDVPKVTIEGPLRDTHGNYTNQILVRIASEPYTLTVDPALSEAMRAGGTKRPEGAVST